ncbi:MAG: NUDIX hydrolase [cyanobacterium endosymbiont of Rhopalodia musculus]|uniref:NUDIX hydrolase n=1 Tax=cyanobacterium endosymbiont of Epithemia clementina EcSB TaxID=3034674 RepID=UPI002480CE4C|nr:NUDIX domain-containing protein [cyanobacterium endosymbiont of Epithemia clementina EcSB]WGT68352.1 NUDIX domain-containing protein [cyanobacterium endosymbiont of Epithemia clementina EcSB]
MRSHKYSSPPQLSLTNIEYKDTKFPLQVALAIVYQEDNFLLQLRDNIPTIAYPNCWGLFGGHVESEENPKQALKRELVEEINYKVSNPIKFRVYNEPNITRYLYSSPLTVAIEQLVLQEGVDFGLVPVNMIKQGQCYSPKTDQVHPIGKVHQAILLDFFEYNLKLKENIVITSTHT